MSKKYELSDVTEDIGNGFTLHRIKALKDFSNVKKGDLGGWIESEDNLSQKGNCWVYDNARVYDGSKVCDNALVCGNSIISGRSGISNNAFICDTIVENCSYVKDSIRVDNSIIKDCAVLKGCYSIEDSIIRCPFCLHYVNLYTGPYNFKDMELMYEDEYLIIKGIGYKQRATIAYRVKEEAHETYNLRISCGCFTGDIHEFYDRVNRTYTKSFKKFGEEYKIFIDLICKHFDIENLLCK